MTPSEPLRSDFLEPLAGPGQRLTALQAFYLSRLAWLLRQHRTLAPRLDGADCRLRLLNKAIFSVFCDCLAFWVCDAACWLFQRVSSYQVRCLD